MTKRQFLIGARLFFSGVFLATFISLIFRLAEHHSFYPWNFFSYFTNLSNILAAFILIVSALYLATHRKPSRLDDMIRGAGVLYMTITGAIYITLLSGHDVGLLGPVYNAVLHYLMPLVVLLDWLYQPLRSKLRFKHIWVWLVFPVAYLIYTLIRGAVINWYPYPFLNPDKVGGYVGVTLYSILVLAVFLGVSWLMVRLNSRLKRHV